VSDRTHQPDLRSTLYRGYVSTFKGFKPNQGLSSDAWWDHKYLPLLADLPRDAPILDIGCGDGSLLAYLGRRGFSHAHGIDISAEQVALAARRTVNVVQADALTYLRNHASEYQAVIAVDVLEHFTRDENLALTSEIFKATSTGGRLIVQTANGAGLFPGQVIHGDLTHQTIFTPDSLAQLLRSVGFINFTFCETGPIPLRLRGKVDVALWSAIKALANAVRHVETGKRQAIWTENFICRAFRPD
jgi:2-polyprenyl-3-methyl-5-hydroxy-6-metoxy-1,4-benzoquinol methylase